MGKPLDNRQRVKNPRKRDRYTSARKPTPSPAGSKPLTERLEQLRKPTRGDRSQ